MRKTVFVSDRLEPGGFANWVVRVPTTLYMYRLDDTLILNIRQVVFDTVGLGNRLDITFQPWCQRTCLQPRIAVVLKVPKMVVRIDYGQGHWFLSFYRRRDGGSANVPEHLFLRVHGTDSIPQQPV